MDITEIESNIMVIPDEPLPVLIAHSFVAVRSQLLGNKTADAGSDIALQNNSTYVQLSFNSHTEIQLKLPEIS